MNTNRAGYLPHSGVMVEELTSIVEALPKGVFIDATYGYGSHFKVLKQFNNLELIGFDRDNEAIAAKSDNDYVIKLNFSEIPNFLTENNLNRISGIFYDFGLSSHQIDSSERGFSFQQNADLDMRMDKEHNLTAKKVINEYSKDELLNILNKQKHVFQKYIVDAKLKSKFTPKINFYIDNTFDEAEKISKLLLNEKVTRDLKNE